MDKLGTDLWNCSFSHIYIEKEALNYNISSKIASHFKNSTIIEIEHYKDVFCRSHQNFVLQKNSPKLILAVKKNNFVYHGSEMCDSFGNSNFYYTSAVMNCIYNCEYCYLQGMYPSGNIVIFVNLEDTIAEVEKMLKLHSVYLCVTYDTDLMAMEGITGFLHRWIETAARYDKLKIEIRTKSANFKAISDIKCCENVILAWTLSPEEIVSEFEKNTPALKQRLDSVCEAIDNGWKVRLCFDPLLYVKDWRALYRKCVETTFEAINGREINDVSIGVFRVSKEYFKLMNKLRPASKVLSYPFSTEEGICSYNKKHIDDMISFVKGETEKYVPTDKIYV